MPSASSTPVVALDLGTSSVRALACDEAAEPIDGLVARRSVRPHQDSAGAGELSAPDYLEALIDCLDELVGTGRLTDVRTVATSSQWHSVLACDEQGAARSPALTWLDTRASADLRPADEAAFHRRTGSWLHPLYWTTKIPWLHRELAVERARFVGITEYIRQALLASGDISVSMASGSGMLDVHAGGWDAEAVELAGVTERSLPPISDAPARLTGNYTRRWPVLAEAEWMPATGDGACSTVGAGCPNGTVGVTVGTSAAIRVTHTTEHAPALAPDLWRYRVDATRLLTGAAVSSGGVLHEWLGGLLGDVSDPIDPPGQASNGVTVVPMHAGSRPPLVLPAGSGVVAGLSLATSTQQLVAATYEGVVFELLRSLRLLDEEFGAQLPVVLGGGAMVASAWWRRAFGAAFDRDVRYQPHPEVGARGAAMLALGLDAMRPADPLEVVPTEVEAMRAADERYASVRARVLS